MTISQLGLFFPSLEIPQKRQIVIDYIACDVSEADGARWTQYALPTPDELEQLSHARQIERNWNFLFPIKNFLRKRKPCRGPLSPWLRFPPAP